MKRTKRVNNNLMIGGHGLKLWSNSKLIATMSIIMKAWPLLLTICRLISMRTNNLLFWILHCNLNKQQIGQEISSRRQYKVPYSLAILRKQFDMALGNWTMKLMGFMRNMRWCWYIELKLLTACKLNYQSRKENKRSCPWGK